MKSRTGAKPKRILRDTVKRPYVFGSKKLNDDKTNKIKLWEEKLQSDLDNSVIEEKIENIDTENKYYRSITEGVTVIIMDNETNEVIGEEQLVIRR